jgi:hypothetical protein
MCTQNRPSRPGISLAISGYVRSDRSLASTVPSVWRSAADNST